MAPEDAAELLLKPLNRSFDAAHDSSQRAAVTRTSTEPLNALCSRSGNSQRLQAVMLTLLSCADACSQLDPSHLSSTGQCMTLHSLTSRAHSPESL